MYLKNIAKPPRFNHVMGALQFYGSRVGSQYILYNSKEFLVPLEVENSFILYRQWLSIYFNVAKMRCAVQVIA
jgi:hypothetical protein